MAIEIDCKAIAGKIEAEAREMAAKFEAKMGRKPRITTFIANNDPASERYVRNKMKACERCGIEHIEFTYDELEEQKVKEAIEIANHYHSCVMLQLPVYEGWCANNLIQCIDPAGDVDCLTAQNMGKLALGDNSFMPATVAGIMRLFKEEGYDLKGKTVVIRGRSNIVGKPLALAMINAGATVISENSHTPGYFEIALRDDVDFVDVIIDATGRKAKWTVPCEYYIDVTTIVDKYGKLHGSLNDDCCYKYTPVPRGVGLLTCAQLAWNTAYLACKQVGIEVDL